MHKPLLLVLSLSACLLATACSGTPTGEAPAAPKPPAAATPLNAKALEASAVFTQSDAEHLLNRVLTPGRLSSEPVVGLKLCVYEKEDAFCQVTLTQKNAMTAENLAAGQSPKAIFETLKQNYPKAKQLENVGDDNFLAPPGLHILKGDYYITLSFGGENNKLGAEKWQSAGQTAVANLLKNLP